MLLLGQLDIFKHISTPTELWTQLCLKKKRENKKRSRMREREKGINIVIGQKHFPGSGRPGWIFYFS